MNAKTLKALKLSIAHWERLASGMRDDGEDIGPTHCSLCSLFYWKDWDVKCDGCPVKDKTKLRYCAGSPWANIEIEFLNGERTHFLDDDDFKAMAKLELEFLKSLLPNKRKKA